MVVAQLLHEHRLVLHSVQHLQQARARNRWTSLMATDRIELREHPNSDFYTCFPFSARQVQGSDTRR